MKDQDVCSSKVFYEGEFAAQRGAAIAEHRWGEEMVHYLCLSGRHWHIAHKYPQERNRFPRREKKDWCDVCDQPINPVRYWKHILTVRHNRLEALQKEKSQGG